MRQIAFLVENWGQLELDGSRFLVRERPPLCRYKTSINGHVNAASPRLRTREARTDGSRFLC